jgi:hypothetical protein|tara:strand:+ start:913 stop:1338 length:426 start_codon:yes stop_codon:yes gene_type:complete
MKNTNKLVIAVKNRDLMITNLEDPFMCGEGKYRVITKCRAGFMVTSVIEASSAINALRRYKIKAVQSIARIKEVDGIGNYEFTIFARNGKKIWIEEDMLATMTVGDINQDLSKTALYNQFQYQSVNAKTWADKAYVMNEGQ